MLGHRTSLSKFKKIISSIFSKQQLETRNKLQEKKKLQITQTQRLNSMLLNNQWVAEEMKEEI